jgi:hypothetical protein
MANGRRSPKSPAQASNEPQKIHLGNHYYAEIDVANGQVSIPPFLTLSKAKVEEVWNALNPKQEESPNESTNDNSNVTDNGSSTGETESQNPDNSSTSTPQETPPYSKVDDMDQEESGQESDAGSKAEEKDVEDENRERSDEVTT